MLSDFWWLSPEEATQYGYINLFHQEPYSDEPNTDKDPLSCPMLQSDKRCTLGFTNQWRKKFRNINVFRSFALYGSDSNGEAIVGPFLLDVDRTIEKEGGYIADIGKALEDARLLAKTCCSNLEDKHYRIFFTGHKGFHIEINPKSLNIPPNTDYSECFEHRRKDINNRGLYT